VSGRQGGLAEGFHPNVPADAYHRDPAPEPSLSASMAKLLLEHSPMHAWHAHPRLNPAAEERHADNLDLGELAHSLILEGEARVVVVDADDWRAKAAREQKTEARLAGKVPVLAKQWERVRGLVRAFERQAGDLLGVGSSEVTALWREERCWCRSRIDFLRGDRAIIDLKTTAGSAHPDKAAKRIFEHGYDIQAAFYSRGVERLTGRPPPRFIFAFLEVDPPHALCLIEVSPASLAMAMRKVEHAIRLWSDCLRTNRWPGYTPDIWQAETPAFVENRWLARETAGDVPAMAMALSRPMEEAQMPKANGGGIPLRYEA
jgi:hypothetical protein